MANESLSQLSDALGIATAQLSGDPQRMQMALGMQQSRRLQEQDRQWNEWIDVNVKDQGKAKLLRLMGREAGIKSIQQTQKQEQETELENQLQESLNRGDTDTALSLAARLGKTSVVQYLQGERRRTEPQLLGDGKYTVSFDESGKPKIDINQEIIDAELELAKKEKEIARIGKTLPATLIKSEDEDFTALSNLGGVETDIDFFIDAVREGNLEVGYGEDIQAAFGNLGIMRQYMDAESKEKLANYNAFERWKQTYVNESLRLNKGPQTEGDAQRAMKELEAAKTPEDVLRVLQDLKKTNAREVKFRKEQINRRRSTADVDPYDFSNLSWKIIE
jgi:hypothetical protein